MTKNEAENFVRRIAAKWLETVQSSSHPIVSGTQRDLTGAENS